MAGCWPSPAPTKPREMDHPVLGDSWYRPLPGQATGQTIWAARGPAVMVDNSSASLCPGKFGRGLVTSSRTLGLLFYEMGREIKEITCTAGMGTALLQGHKKLSL